MKTILLIFLPFLGIAQTSILPAPSPQEQAQPLAAKWTLSVTLGWHTLGPAASIKQQMSQTGWGYTDPGFCFIGCGPIYYPRIDQNATFDLEVGYQKSAGRGYQIGFGLPQTATITGLMDPNARLYINTRIWYGSFRWAWFSPNGRLVGSIGPSLMLFQDSGYPSRHSQIIPGLHLSSQYRFVDRPVWLLAVKADIRLGWPATTQKYEATNYLSSSPLIPTVQFPGMTVTTTQVSIGFHLGMKIN